MVWRDSSLSAATRETRLQAIRAGKLRRERAARVREEEARLDALNRDKVAAVRLEHDMQREALVALYAERIARDSCYCLCLECTTVQSSYSTRYCRLYSTRYSTVLYIQWYRVAH